MNVVKKIQNKKRQVMIMVHIKYIQKQMKINIGVIVNKVK